MLEVSENTYVPVRERLEANRAATSYQSRAPSAHGPKVPNGRRSTVSVSAAAFARPSDAAGGPS